MAKSDKALKAHVHHVHPKKKTGYDKWAETLLKGMKEGQPDLWDHDLSAALVEFDQVLKDKPGYKTPDFRLLKALMLTETGGPNDDSWYTNPMQIGNKGDPGLQEVIDPQRLGEALVVPPILVEDIKRDRASGALTPPVSIRAGICYMLMLAVQAENQTILDTEDTDDHTFKIEHGDTLEGLAKKFDTTQDNIKRNNPHWPHVLHPSAKEYKYQKAKRMTVITGFHMITPEFLMKKYNTKDPNYARKILYALSLQ